MAGESVSLGDFATAERLYAECLRGEHRHAPDVMLGLAGAQFGRGDHAAARETLEALIRANPDFRSPDGHLMYARCLEALGETEPALREYAALADGFPGEEGRTRHALLLKRCGRSDEAQAIFRQVLARSRVAPGYYWREQREWIERARGELRPDA